MGKLTGHSVYRTLYSNKRLAAGSGDGSVYQVEGGEQIYQTWYRLFVGWTTMTWMTLLQKKLK